jgi:hypothetical protein
MSENDINDLVTINGVQIRDGDTLEIQVAFDGETITFRDEDGELQDMGILCYLHFIIHKSIETMCDDEGNELNPDGITPGHVISHLIQYLHDQHHTLMVHNRMATLANALGSKGETPDETGMSLFKFGEDGIEAITEIELVKTIKKIRDGEILDDVAKNATSDEDDEDEIIVHGPIDDPFRRH